MGGVSWTARSLFHVQSSPVVCVDLCMSGCFFGRQLEAYFMFRAQLLSVFDFFQFRTVPGQVLFWWAVRKLPDTCFNLILSDLYLGKWCFMPSQEKDLIHVDPVAAHLVFLQAQHDVLTGEAKVHCLQFRQSGGLN